MYSVSNINCNGCMNSNRKMKLVSTGKEQDCLLEIIKNIPMPVPDYSSLYLCWECTAELNRFSKFKEQVAQSYKILNTIESGTVNKKCKPQERLQVQDLFNIDYQPDEGIESYFEVIKVDYQENEDSDVKMEMDHYSNDDEKPLIEICKKRKKKKVVNGDKFKNEALEYTEIQLNEVEIEEERNSLQKQEDYLNAMFRCEKCLLSFPNADDLKDHLQIKHDRNAAYSKCKICECTFRLEVSFNYHMRRHTTRYQCKACTERFASKRSAVKHYNMTHCLGTEIDFDYENPQDISSKTTDNSEDQSKPASFPCEFCPKSFQWRTSLRKHLETHRIENGQKRRPYCEPCKLSFTTTSNLQKHVKTSSKHQIQLKLWKLNQSAAGGAEGGAEAATHADIRSAVNRASERFACAQCGARYQWRGNLLRHLKSHQAKAQGSLVCAPCNRSFSSIATYRQHMTVSKKHVSEDDFKFMCSECGRRFANRTRLRDHVDWDHLKNYVHTCDACQKVFKSHTSLYLHKQVVHRKEQPDHLCDHCGKPFPNQAKLRSHVTALHSGAAAYRCGDCGARFAWHSCLSRHMRRSHRKRTHDAPSAHATAGAHVIHSHATAGAHVTHSHATADVHATHTHATQNAHAPINVLATHAQ